jgi:hypothetical protein
VRLLTTCDHVYVRLLTTCDQRERESALGHYMATAAATGSGEPGERERGGETEDDGAEDDGAGEADSDATASLDSDAW